MDLLKPIRGAEGAMGPRTRCGSVSRGVESLATQCTSLGGMWWCDHNTPGRKAEQALGDLASGIHQELFAPLHVCTQFPGLLKG